MECNKAEIKRQLFHIALGISIVILSYFEILTLIELLTILLVGIFLAIMAKRWKIPGINWCLQTFERKNARFAGEGATFFILGCFLALGLFPKQIALASIMILAIGDSFATLIGTHWGKRKLKNKSLEGSLAGFSTGILGALIFVPIGPAFFGTLGAMAFEAVEWKFFGKNFDDNLFIPLIAGIIMYGVQAI